MKTQNALTLVDQSTGHLAFKVFSFEDNSFFDHIQRNNYYSLIWIHSGDGEVKDGLSRHRFFAGHLLAFSPYQPFMLLPDGEVSGTTLQFHPDFFCIHKHHQEVACHGVLFNNIYEPPTVAIDAANAEILRMHIEQVRAEMQNPAVAQYELLISYLKIILILASRLKAVQHQGAATATANSKEPFVLQSLKDAIESNYKEKHSASDYAVMLNITPKALGRITRTHLNKTLTTLISERIIIEAKRELYLTSKPVKQIAWELGYQDEYYFSRFFKTNTDVSPQIYRNTVGQDRQ